MAKVTRPSWPGMDLFQGRDRASAELARGPGLPGKNVLVIGSGATAATLVPAMAEDCRARHHAAALAHLLQHGRNASLADELRELGVDEDWIHEIVRRKILYEKANSPAGRSPNPPK